MMLLPWYFEWPQENEWIQDAYSGFSAWVQDAAQTNWILTSQDDNLIVERGDFSSEEATPVIPDLVSHTVENLPVENYKTNVYDAATTYKNGVFISVDDIVIAEGATAVLKVTYNYKTEVPMYLNDANNKQLYKDNSVDNNGPSWKWGSQYKDELNQAIAQNTYTPITLSYPLTYDMLQRVVDTGGIWLLAQGDILFNVKKADLEINGWIDPSTVQDLSVTPTSMVFNTTATQSITATSSTTSNFTFSSSDTNVATVSAEGVVTPGANGTAIITVTAEAEGSLGARKKTVNVTVNYTHQIQLTKDSEALTSLTINSQEAQTFTATSSTNGSLSVESSDNSVVTVSISGSTVTVTPVANGTATITVTASGGTLATATKEVSVIVNIEPENIATLTLGEIQTSNEKDYDNFRDYRLASTTKDFSTWTNGATLQLTFSGSGGPYVSLRTSTDSSSEFKGGWTSGNSPTFTLTQTEIQNFLNSGAYIFYTNWATLDSAVLTKIE